ncbi:MAG: PilT/PilU family type 4a pilus ATPase [Burkholderiales bacterium]
MFLDPLFKLMADKYASDLFVTAGAPIQIKIAGNVVPVNSQVIDAASAKKIALEMMSEEQVRDFESRMEMNFAHSVPSVGSFRVNVFRQRGAVAIVVRHVKMEIPEITELGLPPQLRDLIMEKRGLVLVVGSTGCGKSTTLAAMIEHRNTTRSGHILTIEDPIEFVFKHKKSIVNQREVGMDTLSYETALVNAMREAPDVLMIGEIRERGTLTQALIYAQTGHLCLSTLHANNSYHALNRIINFFPHDARASLLMDLSISLRCVISQRLVRDVNNRLVPAVEILLNTKHIAELIKGGSTDEIKEAMEKSLSPGCQTFEQALFKLYDEGKITMDEALAHSDSPTNLSWIINNAKTQGASGRPVKTAGTKSLDPGDINFNLDVV